MSAVPQPIERLDFLDRSTPLIKAIIKATPTLLSHAAAYADYIDGSWRHFNVGSGSLAVDEGGDYFAVYGANYKASEETSDENRLCAERLAVYRADKAGLKLHTFHVDAPRQTDTHSRNTFPTTHSCGLCRGGEHTMKHPIVDQNVTVVTRRRATWLHQVYSGVELDLVHAAPQQYPELATCSFLDPECVYLQTEGLERSDALLSRQPFEGPVITPARAIRTSWAAREVSEAA